MDFPRNTCGFPAEYLQISEFAGVLPGDPVFCAIACVLRGFLRVSCRFSAFGLRVILRESSGILMADRFIFSARFG